MILVTGATGFIGSSLIPYLEHRGIGTIGVSRSCGKSLNTYFDSQMLIEDSIIGIIHLAGKAHDVHNSANFQEYYDVNTQLTIKLFDAFLESSASIFIYVSSIKALCDSSSVPLTEEMTPSPQTPYGDSKLKAEEYLLSKIIPPEKKLIILRPAMVHGPGNKGNLNMLYKFIKKGIPYPLAAFDNQRSLLSIENFCFVVYELLTQKEIVSGVYHICDDNVISTSRIVEIISQSLNKPVRMMKIPIGVIKIIASLGNILSLPFNTERLHKLTDSFIVSNTKLISMIRKPLPVKAEEGLKKTIESFRNGS